MAQLLNQLGAKVFGLALPPEGDVSLFDQLDLENRLDHAEVDIRDYDRVAQRVAEVEPDILFHLAAQSLVLRSYDAPRETWDTNVGGTTNVLEAARATHKPMTVIVITTDKVYKNREWDQPYRESDRLGGHDPYSASKAACEILTQSWQASFGLEGSLRIASARAGNVIGGGDWAENRIVPDIARAFFKDVAVEVRNPGAVRPWQHVLEPISGYMKLAERLHADLSHARAYNFGPAAEDFHSVRDLLNQFCDVWPGEWRDTSSGSARHEAGLLSVTSDLARRRLGWKPVWSFEQAVSKTAEWYRAHAEGADVTAITDAQIKEFLAA